MKKNMRKTVAFEQGYFRNLIADYLAWEAEDSDVQAFFDNTEWMSFPIRFANDNSIILDAGGKTNLYIEWGANECPVYIDVDGEYTRIARVTNARFWALADRARK